MSSKVGAGDDVGSWRLPERLLGATAAETRRGSCLFCSRFAIPTCRRALLLSSPFSLLSTVKSSGISDALPAVIQA